MTSFFEISILIVLDKKRIGEISVNFLNMFIGFGFCKSADKIITGNVKAKHLYRNVRYCL